MKSEQIDRKAAQALHDGAFASGDLIIWTIYECPSDFPTLFVARPHVVNLKGHAPMPMHLLAPALSILRSQLPAQLHRIDRQENDDPKIVETWL